jgi:hypothetical protein
MDLFTVVEEGIAILRMPKGVFKQTKVYRRGNRCFVPHAGGFIRVCTAFDGRFSTSHPDIKVDAIEAPGLETKGEPAFAASLKAVA